MTLTRAAVVGVLAFLTVLEFAHAFPRNGIAEHRQPRQDDDSDDATTRNPINFGANVAQIIAGAFTGNIDSIIKGSFGFIDDPNVNKLSHNTWETLKGNPTETPPWASTSENPNPPVAQAQPAPEPKPIQPPAAPQAQPVAPQPAAAAPPPAPVQSQPAPESVYAPDVYYSGSPHYPTRSPVRTTQPTYATLAPLSVIEGTGEKEREPEEASTPPTTTEEDDDGDEVESLSGEIGETAVTTGTTSGISSNNRPVKVTTVAAGTGDVETTTEEDDQDQIDYQQIFG